MNTPSGPIGFENNLDGSIRKEWHLASSDYPNDGSKPDVHGFSIRTSIAYDETSQLIVWSLTEGNNITALIDGARITLAIAGLQQDAPEQNSPDFKIVKPAGLWRGFREIIAATDGSFILGAVPADQWQKPSTGFRWPLGFSQSTLWTPDKDGEYSYRQIKFQPIPLTFRANSGLKAQYLSPKRQRLYVFSFELDGSGGTRGTTGITSFALDGSYLAHCEFPSSGPPSVSDLGYRFVAHESEGIVVYDLE